VPLPYVEDSSFKIYKSYIGSHQHMAIIINPKKIKKTPNLRIHSACFTGDIFHSLKCDCGEQLNNSITYMSKNNGGIILYLDQEGRGIGLANKMRAYSLQSRGLDTIDADHNIGFLDDERDFSVASKILSLLEVKNVNIITNNPLKMSAIKKAGIKIINQINTKPTINKYNKNYFKTRIKKTSYRLKIAV
jgi:GTP cyclohydrolase II